MIPLIPTNTRLNRELHADFGIVPNYIGPNAGVAEGVDKRVDMAKIQIKLRDDFTKGNTASSL